MSTSNKHPDEDFQNKMKSLADRIHEFNGDPWHRETLPDAEIFYSTAADINLKDDTVLREMIEDYKASRNNNIMELLNKNREAVRQ
jgi:hypothetical protein